MNLDNAAGHFMKSSIVQPVWNGESAVIMFFVLSGFVLTLPYTGPSPKRIDVVPFIIRRIFRLYPAYWVGILLALLLRFAVFSPTGLYGLSEWANSLWHLPVTWKTLVQHFFMVAPRIQPNAIDPVIWSLIIEMKVSLIFPAVLLLVQHTKKARYALLVMGIAIACNGIFKIFGVLVIFLL